MRFLRAIGHDLVEKRLWPVAVVLVLALVAVPFLLGRGGDSPAATEPAAVAAAPGAASAAATAAEVSVEGEEPSKADRPGDLRDPFRPKGTRTSAKGATPEATPKPSGGAGAAAGGSTGSSSASAKSAPSGGATTPSPATTPTTATTPAGAVKASTTTPTSPVTLKTMRVDLRFGDAEALVTPKVREDVARLTPMPTAKDASIVFLGVLEDRRTAAFLLPEGATAEGEGRCRPSTEECSTIELQAGDTQYVDVPPAKGADGVARQFELTVARVRDATAKTTAAAVAAHRRRSAAGAALVREATEQGDEGLRQYAFRYDRGVLVRRAAKAAAKAG